MTRILLVGYDPETVDFTDPALAGMTAEKVHAGIALGKKHITDRGWDADSCLIRADETAAPTLKRQLASAAYDCVVIGAGVLLLWDRHLAVFEAMINTVHKAAPAAAIAFNRRPQDSADAAGRWLPAG
jgi:hypothetical protein